MRHFLTGVLVTFALINSSRAAYLTDSADVKGMWMLDEEDCVVTLGPDVKPQSRMCFMLKGVKVKPVKLFSDLQLGFFQIDKQFVLARW